MGVALAAQAVPVTWTFQEDGLGDLGSSTRTFTEMGVSLTATSSGPNLYAKSSGGDETGLGLVGTADHEITGRTFIQLTMPTVPLSSLKFIFLGSVQQGELANIYFSPVPGVLGTKLGTVTSDSSFDISGLGAGYLGISGGGKGGADVLLDSVTADVRVPDSGTTVAMLGCALAALGLVRRKLV